MINFKEIAEKCLAGKLSGTFVIDKGKSWHSSYLQRHTILGREMPGQYVLGPGIIYNEIGQCEGRERVRIIDFIPDNMQEQIKIDIPEGKIPVMEQTENGITITWTNKDITYKQVLDYLNENHQLIQYQANMMVNKNDSDFLRKVNVIGKLTNIRNYFGKPGGTESGFYIYKFDENEFKIATTAYPAIYASDVVAFAKREHAEQAIKILGDELKYLFEPW